MYFSIYTVVVGFEHETYSIGEDDGSVEVCVQVNGVLQNSLRLSLTTVDGAATGEQGYSFYIPNCSYLCILHPLQQYYVNKAQLNL